MISHTHKSRWSLPFAEKHRRAQFELALQRAKLSIATVIEIGSRETVWLAVAGVSDIEFIPHPAIQMIEITDTEIYTTAQVNWLRGGKD